MPEFSSKTARESNPQSTRQKTAVLLSSDSVFSEETPVSRPTRRKRSIPAGEMDSARASDCKEGSKSSFRKPWRNETASGSWLWRTESDLSCTQECETCSRSSWEEPWRSLSRWEGGGERTVDFEGFPVFGAEEVAETDAGDRVV